MYVLCTLILLSIHSLFKRPTALEARENPARAEALEDRQKPRKEALQLGRKKRARPPLPGSSRAPHSECRNRTAGAHGQRKPSSRAHLQNTGDPCERVQPVQQCGLLGPAVMFGTRKTWDLSHTPCLQELWNKDLSLDASSVDFLMSDGEEESSFLTLPNTVLQRHCLTSDLPDPHLSDQQQLLIQKVTWSCSWTSAHALQEKVCEFQARLCSEDATKRLLLQQQQTQEEHQDHPNHPNSHEQPHISLQHQYTNQELLEQPSLQENQLRQADSKTGLRRSRSSSGSQRLQGHPDSNGYHLSLISGLHTQIEELEKKLLNQTQEVERLRSELGATDLEKQLELLESENQRLKQELRASYANEPAATCSTSSCPHSQDAEVLRAELSRREEMCRERERRLAVLEQQVQERTVLVAQLQEQLEEASRYRQEIQQQLDEALRSRAESEQQFSTRLRDAEEALSRQAAAPPQIKYVTKTVEVESAQCKQALVEAQARNQALQEQLGVQRELLRELEQQLHESQRTSSQLRQQLSLDRARLCGLLSRAVGKANTEVTCRLSKILVYEGEMERAQGQLEAELQNLEEEKNRVIEEAFIRAESEMKAVHENLAGVRMNLLTLQPALRTLTCDYNCLKRQVQDFPYMLEKAIAEAKQEICQVIGEVSSANQELLRKYKREMNLRKKCHNELVRLKGNIRVFCRVRPVCQDEAESDSKTMVSFDSDDDAVLYLSNKGKLMTFELDKVFPPQITQDEVFQEVQSLVTSCIDGFNVCIFAYGQTGSGKTYTMEGVPEDPGINQRALRLLFSEVSEKKPDWDYNITVSMVEIYNETLRNLLGDNPSEKLDIKMCPDGSGQLYVPGLTEFSVESVEDINRVFELGHMNRATACTNLNEHSSRSHALLIITVAGFNSSTGHRTSGKLNLVDLAGSERIAKSGAEGSRLREAQCINKSLSALGDVINALRSRHSHVPFRNSRLTYLLQDSLSGDSKTLMVVQVSPLESNISESVCSLKFAQRVRTVELGPSSSSRRHAENSSTSSSPTHDSVELDSPPVTPVPLPISRASSAGSTLSSSSKSTSTRRRSQSQLATGRLKVTV
ncbi:kinesin-like protein KIFC3 isoform X2 [Astyanax mexicanus]|uniref:kinesin-like protein KIFC3 isoform X2 n=1 Tax=Astyanax mexicanus TaxID=7994 RepID=UPI0020CB541E|nr:kinesin-like protein KIFC3 isoform X2 [Astyanax mexicanus]